MQPRPIAYSHYQPPPQPIQFPYAQPFPVQVPMPMPVPVPVTALSPMAFHAPPARDFQLFGPSDPLGGIGAGMVTDDDHDHDQGPPDLVSDRGSPSVDSPPSPVPTLVRPPLAAHGNGNASYRGEARASSVPPPEFPRPIRRKTQENHHWPSFVSSSSSSSASSSSSYLPTPHQYPQSFVDEPSPYALPPPPGPPAFDPASLALSPAAHCAPYSYQAPHTDHPLLPSEQSDLLDRVRRDLLDVDLSSIKGPLRALALSGAERSPGHFSMMAPLPSYPRFALAHDRDKTPTPRAHAHAHASPRSPAVSALAHSESAAAASIGTVSPQEAFLDYPAVDSKLHDLDPKDGRLARSDFGVGVGHSLFAPLPTTTSSPLQSLPPQSTSTSSRHPKPMRPPPVPAAAAAPSSSTPTLLLPNFAPPPSNIPLQPPRPRTTTPSASQQQRSQSELSSATTAAAAASSPSSPAAAAASGLKFARPHGRHPFSVPQNAVSWATRRSNSGRHLVGGVADGEDDDGDGDGEFGEPSSSTEVTAGEDDEVAIKDENDDEEHEFASSRRRRRRPDAAALGFDEDADDVGYDHDATPAAAALEFSFVPPPTQSSLLQFASPRRSPPTSFAKPPLLQPLPPPGSGSGTGTGTSTPRRPAAANALAGLQLESPVDDPDADATRSKRQRKRSRLALEEDEAEEDDVEGARGRARSTFGAGGGNYSDRDAEGSSDEYRDDDGDSSTAFAPPRKQQHSDRKGGGDDDDDSDASYHSSSNANTPAASSTTKASAPPPKRRRRAPAAGGGTSAATTSSGGGSGAKAKPLAKGSIACDFVAGDGGTCGVVFRRPYDLARHKETIHGVTMGGEKLPPGKAKEWKCKECGGTFSRKDALLRHGRIRGHKPGV
ncbi:hypothetical protein JCM11491_001778 [Sporobolomyces phaffii]